MIGISTSEPIISDNEIWTNKNKMSRLFIFHSVISALLIGALIIPKAFCQAKTYGKSPKVTFPLGDVSFADEVLDYRLTSKDANSEKNRRANRSDPSAVLGPPLGKEPESLSLGNSRTTCEAYVTVWFKDNNLVDIDGIDLWVFEAGNNTGGIDEPCEIYISTSGRSNSWIYVGSIGGGTGGIDIGPYVSLGQKFKFVRVCDVPNDGKKDHVTTSGVSPGPDIDAIGAIGAEPDVPGPKPEGPDREPPQPPDPPKGPVNVDNPVECGPPSMFMNHKWRDLSGSECTDRSRLCVKKATGSVTDEIGGVVSGVIGNVRVAVECISTIEGVQPEQQTLVGITTASDPRYEQAAMDLRAYLMQCMDNPNLVSNPPVIPKNDNPYPPVIIDDYTNPSGITFGQMLCEDPRVQDIMDEWLRNAIPARDPKLRFNKYALMVGENDSSRITDAGHKPDNAQGIPRCVYLWDYARSTKSTNMGTLEEYVLSRL